MIHPVERLWLLRTGAVDAWSAAIRNDFAVSCRSGCFACCHQVVMCASWEAELIRHFAPVGLVLAAVARGEEMAACIDRADPLPSLARWHSRRIPCAFLGEDGRCQIYAYRPTACSTMWAASPPELCDPATGAVVQKVDNRDLLLYVDGLEREWTDGQPKWGIMGEMLQLV